MMQFPFNYAQSWNCLNRTQPEYYNQLPVKYPLISTLFFLCFHFTASRLALVPAAGPLQAIPGKDGIGLVHERSHRWPHHQASQPAKTHCTVHHCKCRDAPMNLPKQEVSHLAQCNNTRLHI